MKVLIGLLFTLSVVVADPAKLQELYGSDGHDHHGEHSHHDHDTHSRDAPQQSAAINEVSTESSNVAVNRNDGPIFGASTSGRSSGLSSGFPDAANSQNGFSSTHNGQPESSGVGVTGALGGDLSSRGAVTGGSVTNLRGSLDDRSNIERNLLELEATLNDNVGPVDITITDRYTKDEFTTVTNLFYNSIPVTLTEFTKTTVVLPTLQVLSTPVDDHVFVATAPATRSQTITVTDTTSAFHCATEISTTFFTITHRVYDIQQQLVTSTLVETQLFRPTIVSTRIETEYDTETSVHTVTNTVVVQPRTENLFENSFAESRLLRGSNEPIRGLNELRSSESITVPIEDQREVFQRLQALERRRALLEAEQKEFRQRFGQQHRLDAPRPLYY